MTPPSLQAQIAEILYDSVSGWIDFAVLQKGLTDPNGNLILPKPVVTHLTALTNADWDTLSPEHREDFLALASTIIQQCYPHDFLQLCLSKIQDQEFLIHDANQFIDE